MLILAIVVGGVAALGIIGLIGLKIVEDIRDPFNEPFPKKRDDEGNES